jgi:hypothetical protein
MSIGAAGVGLWIEGVGDDETEVVLSSDSGVPLRESSRHPCNRNGMTINEKVLAPIVNIRHLVPDIPIVPLNLNYSMNMFSYNV